MVHVLPSVHIFIIKLKTTVSSSICIVTPFPDGHFDMSALDRLEKVAGISIFNKKLLDMASALCFDESTLHCLRRENNPVEGVKFMFKAWLSGKSFLPPTWQVLLDKL